MTGFTNSVISAGTMVDVLQRQAEAAPDAQAFLFLPDGEAEGPRLTYAKLDGHSRALGSVLRDKADPGDRALLLYEPGLDFIPALFGCWCAGVVPVPAYVPRRERTARNWETINSIAADCRPRLILTTAELAARLPREFISPAPGVRVEWIATDQMDGSQAGRGHEPGIETDSPALLQYTSGSTAAPKGVMVTHANLLHNESLIHLAMHHPGPSRGVCWLPLYHDMGLVGFVLQTVYRGGQTILLPPAVLVQRPIRWLQAISRYRAHISGGPNFAYDLCVQRIAAEQKATLDLSAWNIAFVGAEPVSAATLEQFAAAFEPCGFRAEAWYPCYGLAEATLFVTGGASSDSPGGVSRAVTSPIVLSVRADELEQGRVVPAEPAASNSRRLVGCGRAWPGTEVAIVEPQERTRCPNGTVGEIWVQSPSVARGYWNRAEETDSTFRAKLHPAGAGEFLRTGDLGFLHNGELFVTGRLKDLLVFHGRNHYPQDIEATVQAVHSALREGGGAAFESGSDGQPCLIVVQELDRRLGRGLDLSALAGDIRQAVAARHELRVDDVLFLEPGTLPRTSSSKVRRHACRLGYERNTLCRWTES